MLIKERTKKPNFENINNYFASNQKNIPSKKSIEQKQNKKSTKKSINNFEKITGSSGINITGSQPIVMFKKPSNNKESKSPNPLNSKYVINKTKFDYVSDGGMTQKIQKYNSNNNLNNNKSNNIYHYNNYISEKVHILPNNKNKKNNLEKNKNIINNTNKQKKQILSKTLREFHKRPLIQNNKDNNKEKEINNKTKNSFDEKKIKHKMGNLNIIKNAKLYNKANNEDSKNQEEQKLTRMKQLVENGVVNEIKKLENKIKIQKKDIKIERKKEVLENQGLLMNNLNEENNEEENKSDSYININFNRQLMSKSTRGFYPRINNYLFQSEKNNFEENNINQLKEKKKPSVNPLEFINKINNEKKKLNPNEIYAQNLNIHHSSNMLQKRKLKSGNMELNDSFRHKNSKKPKNIDINNLKIKYKSFKGGINNKDKDELNDEFPFAHRKNHRTPEELKDFLKKKKIKTKKRRRRYITRKTQKIISTL